MVDQLWIIGPILVAISLCYTYFLSKKLENTVVNKLIEAKDEFDVVLRPIIHANSRAMGAISGLAHDTQMDQALERRIGADLLGQNEDILEIIKMAFPSVSEYIEEHPEAVTKLMPRLNQLIQDPEARKRLNLDTKGFGGKDLKRIWEG